MWRDEYQISSLTWSVESLWDLTYAGDFVMNYCPSRDVSETCNSFGNWFGITTFDMFTQARFVMGLSLVLEKVPGVCTHKLLKAWRSGLH
jgi:hypothetical protein